MSFFRALFDFSFSEYITTKIIKFLYVVTIVIAALTWIGVLIASFFVKGSGVVPVIGAIIFCPIAFIVQLIFTRVGYEILIVVFGIAENVHDMAWALTGGRKAPSATNPPAPQYPQPGQYPQQPQYPPQQPPQPQYPQYPQYPQQPPQQYPPQKP